MKIINSDKSVLVVKDSNTSVVIISGSIFLVVGVYLILLPILGPILHPKSYYNRVGLILISLFPLLIGSVIMLFAKSYVTTCDRTSHMVSISTTSLIRKTEVSISIDDIKSISVNQMQGGLGSAFDITSGKFGPSISTTASLLLVNGNRVRLSTILLGTITSSGLNESENPTPLSSSLQNSLQVLSQFIQKPIEVQSPPLRKWELP
jgi:hypothetical protein